jgi:hypothetical protein
MDFGATQSNDTPMKPGEARASDVVIPYVLPFEEI